MVINHDNYIEPPVAGAVCHCVRDGNIVEHYLNYIVQVNKAGSRGLPVELVLLWLRFAGWVDLSSYLDFLCRPGLSF